MTVNVQDLERIKGEFQEKSQPSYKIGYGTEYKWLINIL